MSNNAYDSRKRWNAANYKQINIAVSPELAEAFRVACAGNNVPMREVLLECMSAYAATPAAPKKKNKQNYSERSLRRKAVKAIISQLQSICDAEEQYKENIPENLKNSSRYEAAEQAVEVLEEIIERLQDAFP